jgi:hypothetical protein
MQEAKMINNGTGEPVPKARSRSERKQTEEKKSATFHVNDIFQIFVSHGLVAFRQEPGGG